MPNQCKLPYTACIQSEIPRTPTINFEEINKRGDLKLKEWPSDQQGQGNGEDHFRNLVVEQIENKQYTETNIGTQQISYGDSGSGHWMHNKDEGVRVLVGISMAGIKGGGPSMIQKITESESLAFIKHNLVY